MFSTKDVLGDLQKLDKRIDIFMKEKKYYESIDLLKEKIGK